MKGTESATQRKQWTKLKTSKQTKKQSEAWTVAKAIAAKPRCTVPAMGSFGRKCLVFRPKSLDTGPQETKRPSLQRRERPTFSLQREGHPQACIRASALHGLHGLSAPDQRPRPTDLTCRLSGVPGEAGRDAAPSQGQEENGPSGPKESAVKK